MSEPQIVIGIHEIEWVRQMLGDPEWCRIAGPYHVGRFKESLLRTEHAIALAAAMSDDNPYAGQQQAQNVLNNADAAQQWLYGNPYVWQPPIPDLKPGTPHAEPESDQERTDRLWRAVVDAAKGNG